MTQEEAFTIMDSGENCFLTGRAGTWKSYLTEKFIQNKRDNGKSVIVVAPTGIAAINIGWATIHSTFKMFGTYLLKRPIKPQTVNWMYINTIIIDEISMVWPDFLDYIDYLLKEERWSDAPFGGIQMILVWDKKQLPPVYVARTPAEQYDLDKLTEKYGQLTFDKAESYKWFHEIELQEIKRTTDTKLIEILNSIREWDMSVLSQIQKWKWDNETVHLKPFNTLVDKHNQQKYLSLPWEGTIYTGKMSWDFKENECITPLKLSLKVWARVMVTKNLECWLVNGDLGTVEELHKDYVVIHSDRYDSSYDIDIVQWKRIEYQGMSEKEIWSFSQIPLKLAWAMTIHKSQGLTLDNVCVTYTKNMAKELTYVWLSRATSYEKLFLHTI